MNCVYVLRSLKDGKKYIGSTIHVVKRLQQHNKGQVPSTKFRRPLKLIGYQITPSIEEAGE
ncbi:GIY-YIG nuclease family protein [Patescibacteria group bacterium]|nr:GIY-YIG nuclease family protein [Patescibacteria group bacterium]